jgi:hypothetical protein
MSRPSTVGSVPSGSTALPAGSGLTPAGGPNSDWVNVTPGIPSGPPPRSNASAVYDPLGPYLLLFGGQIGPTPLNDTWTFANGLWTQLHTRNSPVARFGAGITFDALDHYVVLFGGATSSGPSGVIQLNATWNFSGGNWHHLGTYTPPRGRSFPGFAYDPIMNANVLFGGLLPSNQSAQTWELAGTKWTPLTPGGSGEPPTRVAASMVFDSDSNQLILFGGWDPETSGPLILNDTWIYSWNQAEPDASIWVEESTPSNLAARYDAAVAFNPTLNAVVLFGGQGTNRVLNDTWLWNGTDWIPLPGTSPSPSPRLGDLLSECPTPAGSTASPTLANILLGGSPAPGLQAADVWFFGILPLSVLPPIISPSALDVGHPGTLSVFAFGGSSRSYSYSWAELPPGCPSQNAAEFSCTPSGSAITPFLVSVSVRNATGVAATSPTAAWIVNAIPSVTQFTALPSPVPADSSLTVTVYYAGGTGPLTFQYSGLPAGCASIDAAQFNCTPQTPGNFTLRVLLTDADGHTVTAVTRGVVGDPIDTGSALWEYVVEGIVIALVAIIALDLVRRKRRFHGGSNPGPQPPNHPPADADNAWNETPTGVPTNRSASDGDYPRGGS